MRIKLPGQRQLLLLGNLSLVWAQVPRVYWQAWQAWQGVAGRGRHPHRRQSLMTSGQTCSNIPMRTQLACKNANCLDCLFRALGKRGKRGKLKGTVPVW